jgi:ribonuclease HI
MELRAVIEALEFLSARLANLRSERADARYSPGWLRDGIQVFTDSQYVKNGVNSWLSSWKAKGWKTADKKPVKNRELWEQLDLLLAAGKAEFHWVEGHAGVPDNERCDTLVQMSIANR